MNKVVVLGDGLLGTEFVKQTEWDFISRKKDNFDITNTEDYYKFFIDNFNGVAFWNKYDVIINCIANTNTYSNDKELHWNINYKSVVDLTNFCKKYNIKLVHISTDYVYTNSINEASENDVPIHGNNWYSYTKLLGDSYVQLNENNLVLRGTHKKYPFPYKEAWIDQIGNFDYISKIAELMICLIKDNACGVYNIGTELKTMFELATQSNPVKPIFKPSLAPSKTSMNTNKLQNALKRINQ
jgi:dTDP-4-dehydrorhamnose reductase